MKSCKLHLQICLILIVIAAWSCRSPQKNFEKGNYEKAYHGLVKDLEKGSKNRRDRNFLNSSFQEMIQNNNVETELLLRSRDLVDWESAFNMNEELIEDYILGKRWLDTDFAPLIDNLSSGQDSLAMDIADAYMLYGDELMTNYNSSLDKKWAQEAYQAYLKVEQYRGSDKYLSELIDRTLDEATVDILFVTEVWDRELDWLVDRKFRRLENQNSTFLNVAYSGSVRDPDCFIELNFSKFHVVPGEQRTTDNFSKDIVVGYETVKDTSGTIIEKPVYKTIRASVVTLVQRKNYKWQLRARVDQSVNYCDFRTRNFNTNFLVTARSYITSGDERALPNNMKNLRDEIFNVNEDNIIENLAEDLYQQIREFYF